MSVAYDGLYDLARARGYAVELAVSNVLTAKGHRNVVSCLRVRDRVGKPLVALRLRGIEELPAASEWVINRLYRACL